MSHPSHGAALVRRVAVEYRVALVVLVALLAANVLVYALVVRPLSERVATVEERTRSATLALASARRAEAQAAEAVAAKARAAEHLDTFYASVLPAGLTEARQLVDPRLWQMGERLGLQVRTVGFDVLPPREEGLSRLHIGMELLGSYADARSLIRQIEANPEFVIIDDVRLQEGGGGEGATLQLRLDLSTYYRSEAP